MLFEIDWWNPSNDLSSTFVDPTTRGSHRILVKYENGLLYYQESAGY